MTDAAAYAPTDLDSWLMEAIGRVARLNADKIDLDTPIYRFGVDSRTVMLIVEEAEARFGRIADLDRISPAISLRDLSAALQMAAG